MRKYVEDRRYYRRGKTSQNKKKKLRKWGKNCRMFQIINNKYENEHLKIIPHIFPSFCLPTKKIALMHLDSLPIC